MGASAAAGAGWAPRVRADLRGPAGGLQPTEHRADSSGRGAHPARRGQTSATARGNLDQGSPRPVLWRSSSIFLDASALVRSSSTSSPASVARVFRYDSWAPVIGSSPVVQSSGSLIVLD